jgi:hypothetical protein
MEQLLGHRVEVDRVEDRLASRFAEVFEMEIEEEYPQITQITQIRI